jgi:hypothetical protein
VKGGGRANPPPPPTHTAGLIFPSWWNVRTPESGLCESSVYNIIEKNLNFVFVHLNHVQVGSDYWPGPVSNAGFKIRVLSKIKAGFKIRILSIILKHGIQLWTISWTGQMFLHSYMTCCSACLCLDSTEPFAIVFSWQAFWVSPPRKNWRAVGIKAYCIWPLSAYFSIIISSDVVFIRNRR